jgi:CRP-like cAMP-binding protein
MHKVTGEFQVDIAHLHALGISDPYSPESIAIYKSGKLSSNERLYFSLWSSKFFSAISFPAKSKILIQGQELSDAYFVVKGEMLAIQGAQVERLGPGSVLGLAEGLSGLHYNKTIVALTPVQARVIPLHKVDGILPQLPLFMRQIIQTTVKRTLRKPSETREIK